MTIRTITALPAPSSPARFTESARTPLRVGLVQHRWRPDADALRTALTDAIGEAAALGAAVVFLPELTLSKYPADTRATGAPGRDAEDLTTGPTYSFAAAAAARARGLRPRFPLRTSRRPGRSRFQHGHPGRPVR